jgi:Arc/MetJ-type ribon-helix-helix transcriptional regulator
MDLPAEQAEKLTELKRLIEEGLADEKAGRVVPWDLQEFLKRAREQSNRSK